MKSLQDIQTHAKPRLLALPKSLWLLRLALALTSSLAFSQHLQRHAVTPWTPLPMGQPGLSAHSLKAPPASSPLSATTWTPIGPAPLSLTSPPDSNFNVSGRITGIAAHPIDPNTIWIAAAGGGVWKTIDAGSTWTPLTDPERTLAMGAVAVAPSNPNVLYAGTGEANNSGDSNYGYGILVSTDGGSTWALSTGPADVFTRLATSQIAIDPADANVAYVAMADLAENGLSGNTGIYKTTDGGTTWTNTAAMIDTNDAWSAVIIDPLNSQTLYAAVGAYYGVPGNGVYKSVDAGATWTKLANAPQGTAAGRISLALAPCNDKVLYVSVSASFSSGSADFGALYKFVRSDNAGATFTDLTGGTPNYMGGQGWYDQYIAVDPSTASTVYVAGAAANSILRSTDSGVNWTDISGGAAPTFTSPHVDHHGVAFDANGKLLDGNDGGIYRLDNPATPLWSDLNGNLETIQFTGIGLHPTNPAIAIGGSQDNGTEIYSGSLTWTETDGGDGGYAKFSSCNGNRVYHQIPVASFGTNFFRRSDDGGVTWTTKTSGIDTDVNNQNFYAPFVVDPVNGDRVLYGTNRVWETTNAGDTWTNISDVDTAGFNNGGNNVDALSVARSDANTIYVATGGTFASTSQIFITTDHGMSWMEHDLGVSGRVNDIEVDPKNAQTAYAVINIFNGSSGQVFKTTNGGGTWSNITGNLPAIPTWWVQVGSCADYLFVSNDTGVFSTRDGGTTWNRLGTGLPNAQAVQLELNRNLHILGVATHGRSMWEIQIPAVVTKTTSSIPNGTFGSGTAIPIQVTFDGPVTVTGTPQLALNSGGVANYTSGSGTRTLKFTYTVDRGQSSADLDYASKVALTTSGGAINDTNGNAASLLLPRPGAPGALGANKNIVVH
jgi:photosystem II stability/assembly factor-like uncharacterized protein